MDLMRAPRRQRGFTLIEVIVAIAIGLILLSVAVAGINTYLDYQRNGRAAEWFKTWMGGAQNYVADHSAALLASSGGTVTHAQLKTGGYLPLGFAATDTYGETATLKVIVSSGQLQGLVCGKSTAPIDGMAQRRIAGMIGLAGGWVDPATPTKAVGKAWGPIDLSTYGLGSGDCQVVAAVFVADRAGASDTALHRVATAGHPEFNTMSTDVNMGGNDVNNAGKLNANQLVTPAGNGVRVGDSFFYGGGTGNAAIRTPGSLYIDNQAGSAGATIARVHDIHGDAGSTFTANNISASSTLWSGSAVTTNGNVTAAGAMYASNWFRAQGNTGFYFESHGGGWYMTDNTWIRAYADKNIYTPGEIRGGTVHAVNSLVSDGIVTITQTAVPHGSCSGTGKLVNSNNGSGLLQCDGNSWEPIGGGLSGSWHAGPASTGNYSTTNNTGKAMLVAVMVSGSGCNSYGAYATVGGRMVGHEQNFNGSYAKTGSMLFPVQPGAGFAITVTAYGCATQWSAAYFY